MTSTATVEGIVEFATKIQEQAEKHMEQDGCVEPVAFLFLRKDLDTGLPLLEPELVIVSPHTIGTGFGDNQKEAFSIALQALIQQGNGVAILNLMECWVAEGSDPDALMAWFQKHGTFKDCPGRKEKVTLSLEHEDLQGGVMWMAEILRPEGEPPRLGPWVQDNGLYEGRFYGFFNKPAEA